MEGDFTRNSHDPRKQYSGVLMQQGRVQLDADWNEQWAIQTRALRGALADLIGPHGGPAGRAGFQLEADGHELEVGAGAYYVSGVRCEVAKGAPSIDLERLGLDGMYLAFVEVWDRHVAPVEAPALREPALLGTDTATRAQTVWSLKLQALDEAQQAALKPQTTGDPAGIPLESATKMADELLQQLRARSRPRLRSQAKFEEKRAACAVSPEARYRGPENQLYRVEIHEPPAHRPEGTSPNASTPLLYFKWSRENGSVVFPMEPLQAPLENADSATTTVSMKLGHLGRDARFGLVPGDVVEFVDSTVTLPNIEAVAEKGAPRGRSGVLGTVRKVTPDVREVTIEVHGGDSFEVQDATRSPFLRRWDQRARPESERSDGLVRRGLSQGAIPVYKKDIEGGSWFELEHGVAVQFAKPEAEHEPVENVYARAGDYWTIPARVVTGDVLWPKEKQAGVNVPVALPPHGVDRHVAPIAIVSVTGGDEVKVELDLRKSFAPLAAALT